jgi:hypothetical protein
MNVVFPGFSAIPRSRRPTSAPAAALPRACTRRAPMNPPVNPATARFSVAHHDPV